jgi:uncharacterized protein (DUF1501 family)
MKTQDTQNNGTNEGRRSFIRAGATGAVLLTMGGAAGMVLGSSDAKNAVKAAPLANHKRLVIIVMRGGNDCLNTVIPYHRAAYATLRPTIAISQASALSLAGGPGGASGFMLHPNLTGLQTLWNQNKLAIINHVGYPNENLSHFTSEDIWSYGVRDTFSALGIPISGWIARYADQYAPTAMGVVSIGQGRPKDFIGGTTPPLILSNVQGFKLNIDNAYVDNDTYRKQVIQDVLNNTTWTGRNKQVAEALEQAYGLSSQLQTALTSYNAAPSGTYPNTNPSYSLRDVAVLIKGGFSTDIFYVGFGGFDTHSAQVAGQGALMTNLSDALTSFTNDLKAMGVWNDTTVVVTSEFGRRNYENGSNGTDHGHGNVMFVTGGSVVGGMYGPDITDADMAKEHIDYQIDFRTMYKDMVTQLGHDPAPIFPETIPKPTAIGTNWLT